MTHANHWPAEGDELTVLLTGPHGRALTVRAKAGRVDATSVLISRASLAGPHALWSACVQQDVTVAYQKAGKLVFWRMRMEEVLPSSLYLVSVKPPSPDERRAFVRARLALWVALQAESDATMPAPQLAEVDISASGLSFLSRAEAPVGTALQVQIGTEAHEPLLHCAAVVVRCLVASKGFNIGMRFVAMGSADEERLLQLVYRSRRSALAAKLGKLSGASEAA